MIGGQMLDLKGESSGWEQMVLMKTADLFKASLEFGAILVGVDPAPYSALGEQFGLTYQLLDDLADGDGAIHIFGEQLTIEKIERSQREINNLLGALPREGGQLRTLMEEMTTTHTSCHL
jgi:geranylgeranyl pyrophosphate synthase